MASNRRFRKGSESNYNRRRTESPRASSGQGGESSGRPHRASSFDRNKRFDKKSNDRRSSRGGGRYRDEKPGGSADRNYRGHSERQEGSSAEGYGRKRESSSSFDRRERPNKRRDDRFKSGGGERFRTERSAGRPNKRYQDRSENSRKSADQGGEFDRPRRSSSSFNARKRFEKKGEGRREPREDAKYGDKKPGGRPFRKYDAGSGGNRREGPYQKRGPGRRKEDSREQSSTRGTSWEKKSFVSSRLDRQKSGKGPSKSETSAPNPEGLIRLNKFISNSGVCSRREADDLITMGLITVNGKTITEMGHKVKPTDDVRYEGRRLTAERMVYILLNKPKGVITTTDDPQERNTVMHMIAGACKERVYPVGRLDRNTSGLLLLTNDGDLTDKLTHPSYKAKKIYKAELDKPLTKADFQKIRDGVRLEEGTAMVDDLAVISEDGKTVGIEIHIGWNRVIRRIFEALGYEVTKLDRVVFASLDKKELPRGHWRMLRQEEVVRLKHFQ